MKYVRIRCYFFQQGFTKLIVEKLKEIMCFTDFLWIV